MNEWTLRGLDGSNPLHALASFGALLLSDDLAAGARMRWLRDDGFWRPQIRTTLDAAAWCAGLATRVHGASVTGSTDKGAQADVRRLKAERKKAGDAFKAAQKSATESAKGQGLGKVEARAWVDGELAPLNETIRDLDGRLAEAELALSDTLGFGPAHLGDIIGVSAEVFRRHARRALDPNAGDVATRRQLAGLGSDACLTAERITPTPFSFGNGASGQCLLKDFRATAALVTAASVRATLLDGAVATAAVTSLNWDPCDQRNYALRWRDPQDEVAVTDIVGNALAYLGLGMVTAMPRARGLDAVAFVDRGFEWALWKGWIGVDVVRALLAGRPSKDALHARAARGVVAAYRSDISNPTGKRKFFAPATAI